MAVAIATAAACEGRPPVSRSRSIIGPMAFLIDPPIEPMLAKLTPEIPVGDGWLYEPKWDGFRALVFRDGRSSTSSPAT